MGKTRKVYVSKERIREQLDLIGISLNRLCAETGLYYETIRPCIAKGAIMPDDLELIAKRLDVCTEYLQGKTDYPESYQVMTRIKELHELQKAGVIRDYLSYRLRTSGYKFSDGTPVTEELIQEHELYIDAHINQYLSKLFGSVTEQYFDIVYMNGEV